MFLHNGEYGWTIIDISKWFSHYFLKLKNSVCQYR